MFFNRAMTYSRIVTIGALGLLLLNINACHDKTESYPEFVINDPNVPDKKINDPQEEEEPTVVTPTINPSRLASLTVSPGALTSIFAPDIFQYSVQQSYAVDQVTIAAELNTDSSKLWANGRAIENGSDFVVDLPVGSTLIDLLIVASDGALSRYSLLILRETNTNLPGSGTAIAIPMFYNVQENRQKFISLSAYSNTINYQQATYNTPFDSGIRYRDAISRWSIQSVPINGKLYDGYDEIVTLPHILSSPSDLLYVPNEDYIGTDEFGFSIQDSSGESSVGDITLSIESNPTLPVGIPAWPDLFKTVVPVPIANGDTETLHWYIDNSHPNATDTPRDGESKPRHGTPDTPRVNLPPSDTVFDTSAALFIAGGIEAPYSLNNDSAHRWTLVGSAQNPAYVLGVNNGVNKPVIEHNGTELRLITEYSIIEGLHFKGIIRQEESDTYQQGNVVMRHNIIDGLSSGTIGATLHMNVGDTKVLYDMHIKNGGSFDTTLAEKNTVHGVQVFDVDGYWIVDTLLHDHTGDGIHIEESLATNLYIARNKIHSNQGNALNFLLGYDLMLMENDLWDYRATTFQSTESDGSAVAIQQNVTGQTTAYATLARNRIWDANKAIRYQARYIWTTDNVIWNIHQNENNSIPAYAIEIGNTAFDYYDRVTNNTFQNIDAGIWVSATDNPNIQEHLYSGNIFGELNEDSREKAYFRITENHRRGTTTNYNLYMTPLTIFWGIETLDLNSYQGSTSNAVASLNSIDPLFINAELFNLRLQLLSPAIGANIEHPTYAEFNTQYGSSLNQDADLNTRPVDGTWDIGAFERP